MNNLTKDIINLILQSDFSIQINSACDMPGYVFKIQYSNSYLCLNELEDSNKIELTFFKSDRNIENIFNDYIDFGISFYVSSCDEACFFLKSIH